jgi:hypothetical protein
MLRRIDDLYRLLSSKLAENKTISNRNVPPLKMIVANNILANICIFNQRFPRNNNYSGLPLPEELHEYLVSCANCTS